MSPVKMAPAIEKALLLERCVVTSLGGGVTVSLEMNETWGPGSTLSAPFPGKKDSQACDCPPLPQS